MARKMGKEKDMERKMGKEITNLHLGKEDGKGTNLWMSIHILNLKELLLQLGQAQVLQQMIQIKFLPIVISIGPKISTVRK